MFHDYVSVERYMRDRHQELLALGARGRLARAARSAARRRAASGAGRPLFLLAALAGLGRALVNVGRRLESRAAAAASGSRQRNTAICKEQPTAADC